ncbi:hypothetical protein [Synechococcus sp. RS9916]|uniref:hypothetical protein n=1 Tax=Synechococcus sp. RS9916 TaxID=221359 RepID=UPI0012EA3308|nr:hypothetical protein [Synechococcus sp. RS9916]
MAALDKWGKEHGALDRTACIRLAIDRMINDAPVSSPQASVTASVDVQAREALQKLLARVEALESQLEDIRQQPSSDLKAAADEFLAGF